MKDEEEITALVSTVPTPEATLSGPRHDPDTLRSCTYPTSRLSSKFEPIDQVEVVKESDRMLGAVASGKLSIISEQIKYLQQQAIKVIREAEINMNLHRATCTFEKRTGHIYYLYDRPGLGPYFSILSPEDWGLAPPHQYLGAYRLEPDSTWTEMGAAEEK